MALVLDKMKTSITFALLHPLQPQWVKTRDLVESVLLLARYNFVRIGNLFLLSRVVH